MNLSEINFFNEYTGKYKDAPLGFSWTTLFWGFFPALFRGDWKWAIIQFLLAIVTSGISVLVMPFLYNKLYIKDLLNKGFIPVDASQCEYLVSKGIVGAKQMEILNKRIEKL